MSTTPRVHVHLKVADLERSREFYARFLGTEPAKIRPGYAKFLPEFGPLNLALSAGGAGGPGGPVQHMGIQVDSSARVQEILERVKASGIPVREEIGVDCCFANQDKFWVHDPDGIEWEVYHLNRDLEPPAREISSCATV